MNEFSAQDALELLRSYSRRRDYARLALAHVVQALERRSIEHAASTRLEDEFTELSRINAIARVTAFGSPGYHAAIQREKAKSHLHVSLDAPMTFLDVVEMVCVWWGARRDYDDSRMTWREFAAMNMHIRGFTEEQQWLVREVAEFLPE